MKKTKKPAKQTKLKKPATGVTPVKESPAFDVEKYYPKRKWDGETLTREQQELHSNWLRTLVIDGYTTKDVQAKCVGDLSEGGVSYLWDFAIVKGVPKTYLRFGHTNKKFNRFVPHGFGLDGHHWTDLEIYDAVRFLKDCGFLPENIHS
jgi:hypothetical protein